MGLPPCCIAAPQDIIGIRKCIFFYIESKILGIKIFLIWMRAEMINLFFYGAL
jgi:hypothetical protein